jgi:hypothetical protein
MTTKVSLNNDIETHREFWAQVAIEHDWFVEPFYIHIWIDENNEIVDSVSYKGLTRDVIDQY